MDQQREALRHHIHSFIKPRQVIYVAAKLGIADALQEGSRRSADLAEAIGADPAALHRVLRGLVTLDIVAEDDAGRFELTAGGRLLCHGTPGSLRGEAILHAEQDMAWSALLHTVRTGETAFAHVFGTGLFAHFAEDPDTKEYFNRWMAAGAAETAAVVAATYPFPATGSIVDVGGGQGALLTAILRRHAQLYGVLFDLPHVVDGAQETLASAGVGNRCTIVPGDFFASVPSGGDIYILYRIIHDWDDDRAARILINCRRAMEGTATLLLIDKLMPERAAQAPDVVHLDLDMLVETGGRQRTEDEYRSLLARCGLHMARIVATGTTTSVIEATPVQAPIS